MTREELLGRITKGAAYIEREDITEALRERAKARYDDYCRRLVEMDKLGKEKAEENPVIIAADPKVAACIEEIRTVLQRKIAAYKADPNLDKRKVTSR